jgi:hypothetical protein
MLVENPSRIRPRPRIVDQNHLRVTFVPIALFVVSLLSIAGVLAFGVHAADANGASVSEVECGILLPGILPEGQVISTKGMLVITSSGDATLTCRGNLDPAAAPAHTVIITDQPCALGEGGQVGESHTQVSPNGNVLLVCQNNPGSEPFPTPGPGD